MSSSSSSCQDFWFSVPESSWSELLGGISVECFGVTSSWQWAGMRPGDSSSVPPCRWAVSWYCCIGRHLHSTCFSCSQYRWCHFQLWSVPCTLLGSVSVVSPHKLAGSLNFRIWCRWSRYRGPDIPSLHFSFCFLYTRLLLVSSI